MNDETALAERPMQTDPLSLIAEAVRRGVGAAELAGFFALQERRERNEAEGAFAKAITAFQNEMPAVHKGRSVKNKTGDHRYSFAGYDDIMRIAGPLLRKHGIVVTYDTMPVEGGMLQVVCKVRVGIHAEPSTVAVPIPAANQLVNSTQTMAQAVSYGKRYALCAALNIVTTDEDTDANYSQPNGATLQESMQQSATVTQGQVQMLDDLMRENTKLGGKVKPEAVLKWLGVADWFDLDQAGFAMCRDYLNDLIAKRKAVVQ